MESLLTPVSTAYKEQKTVEDALVESVKPTFATISQTTEVSSPESVLEALRSQPNFETLRNCLSFITVRHESDHGFVIGKPSPIGSQIVNSLVVRTIPAYWSILNEKSEIHGRKKLLHKEERRQLLFCLRSISGFNAVIVRFKTLIQEHKEGTKDETGKRGRLEVLKEYLEVFRALLEGDNVLLDLWKDIADGPSTSQKMIWREIVTLFAGGKLLSTTAEAARLVSDSSKDVFESPWFSDGLQYCKWLGRNFRQWTISLDQLDKQPLQALSELISRSLRLGYSDAVWNELLELILASDVEVRNLNTLTANFSGHDMKSLIDAAIKLLTMRFSVSNEFQYHSGWAKDDSELVNAAAQYLCLVVRGNDTAKSQLITWLTSPSGAGTGESIGIRRAVIAALSTSKSDVELVFEKSLQQFSDQLYIKHSPILQQEVHTQVLLLSAGHLFRMSKMKLSMALRSGPYLSSISNHLNSSSNRCRFLGMVVGESMSKMVDAEDKRVNFKIEDVQTPEAQWFKSLPTVQDTTGPTNCLKSAKTTKSTSEKTSATKNPASQKTPVQQQSKIVAIEELDDDYEEEADDLVPYGKPDSDDEDSDEDPTLVIRNKPTSPVYIRDLITYLRDTESHDRQKLALATASSLIRRKTNFGTEVTEHTVELATLLVGLQDKFELPNFQDLRLQGMIAVILAAPKTMAPWFAKTFFDGDYSLSQRSAILTVLSVSARELAGFGEQDKSLTLVPQPSSLFPSKTLPPKLHTIYTSASAAQQSQLKATKPQKLQQLTSPPVTSTLDSLSASLTNGIIRPLAASSADASTGPDILKVRTFSSRLAVEARRAAPMTNALGPLAASTFIFPLTARFAAHLRNYGATNVLFSPFLLAGFLKTLSLIVHAAGPYAISLEAVTAEYLQLLLGVRQQAHGDRTVAEALLSGVLTLVDVCEGAAGGLRALVETHGREVVEIQAWTDAYFGRTSGGDGEDGRVRSVAAAVLVRIGEVVEKYQALLVGEMGLGR